MALRFSKRIKIAPGIRVNIGKRGISTTLGPKGASLNVNKKGVHLNSSIPGTGLSSRTKILGATTEQSIYRPAERQSDLPVNKPASRPVLVWSITFLVGLFVIWLIA